jgi:hypothetical protein
MREVVFTIEYEKGVDEVMDLFIEHPDLHAQSMGRVGKPFRTV